METEQIVQDLGASCQKNMYISSFLQMRGSVPGLWSQDVSKMVPKPTISFELPDPFHEISGWLFYSTNFLFFLIKLYSKNYKYLYMK